MNGAVEANDTPDAGKESDNPVQKLGPYVSVPEIRRLPDDLHLPFNTIALPGRFVDKGRKYEIRSTTVTMAED